MLECGSQSRHQPSVSQPATSKQHRLSDIADQLSRRCRWQHCDGRAAGATGSQLPRPANPDSDLTWPELEVALGGAAWLFWQDSVRFGCTRYNQEQKMLEVEIQIVVTAATDPPPAATTKLK